MNKLKFAILKNESDDDYQYWVNSCETFNIDYEIIDLLKYTWFDKLSTYKFDALLVSPPGLEAHLKKNFDEKTYILDKLLDYLLYPNFDEISLHENKKYLSYWLKANKLPHPETNVFLAKEDALKYIEDCKFPLVGKLNIGASGYGVKIIKTQEVAKDYIRKAFSRTGLRMYFGPNTKMGDYSNRIMNVLKNPGLILQKIKIYKQYYDATQKNLVIFQKYIPHEFEWRVVRIGDSYFGHQKVKQGNKASGTKGIDYVCPPEDLLGFVRSICHRFNFNSMAIDLFEDGSGGYLINEMQTKFGHVQEYICEKNGKPGRFQLLNNKWIFEEGLFNTNLSYDLRLQNLLELLKKKNNLCPV